MRTVAFVSPGKQFRKATEAREVFVPAARLLHLETVGSELEALASATLSRTRHVRSASGRLLTSMAALLPPDTQARWREEWLGELHTLPARRHRARFAAHTVLGVPRLAVTLRRPAPAAGRHISALRHSCLRARAVQYGWSGCVWLYAVIACSGMLPSAPISKPAFSAQVRASAVLACHREPLISPCGSLARASRIASATSSAERRVRFMASSAKTARESSSTARPGRWRSRARTVSVSSSSLKAPAGLSNRPS